MERIRIIIVDDIKNTRESIRRILNVESAFEVVGEASCGSEALRLTELLRPDIALMDVSMPDIDGIKTAELLSFRAPNTSVIMMSVENTSENMTRAMLAGAKSYITKPFSASELTSTIFNVYHKETRKREIIGSPLTPIHDQEKKSSATVISFFSSKGGVGKTTTAVNLAVDLCKSKSAKVLLMDLNLQFGDIASFLNLVPKRTITDLAQNNSIKEEDIRFHILNHSSGVDVLAASTRPEYAEMVKTEHIQQIIEEIKHHYDYIICDNTSHFDDISLTSLEIASEIWVVIGMDIPAIKNTKLSLEVLNSLEYSEKVKLILNKFDKRIGIRIKDIESSLGKRINYMMPYEEQLISILNKGIPFIEALPRSESAQEIKKMVKDLVEISPLITQMEDMKVKGSGLHWRVESAQKILGIGR